jgi:ribonucleoside-diphosphate reductase alpha chain
MTGIASNKVKDYDMFIANDIIKDVNADIANRIGIRSAARRTAIKPAGTTSIVFGTSSGIHAWHNDFYIRRLRVGKNESIYQYLATNHPELVEDEFFSPHDTAVISVPQKAPDNAITRNESTGDLLERVRFYSERWVKPGHGRGPNTHNISATVSVKDHEWDDVRNWMWANHNTYNGIAILPFNGGNYVQPPFEDCTEAEYNRLMLSLKEVDLTNVHEIDDNTDQKQELACGSTGCEII